MCLRQPNGLPSAPRASANRRTSSDTHSCEASKTRSAWASGATEESAPFVLDGAARRDSPTGSNAATRWLRRCPYNWAEIPTTGGSYRGQLVTRHHTIPGIGSVRRLMPARPKSATVELKVRLKDMSMNAEIVDRLRGSFDRDDLLTAIRRVVSEASHV